MTTAGDEQIRPGPSGECAGEIEEKKQGNERINVAQLIGPGARVKRVIGLAARFGDAGMNQPPIVDKKEPHNSREDRSQLKPNQWIVKTAIENRFAECDTDAETVVPNFNRPTTHRPAQHD